MQLITRKLFDFGENEDILILDQLHIFESPKALRDKVPVVQFTGGTYISGGVDGDIVTFSIVNNGIILRENGRLPFDVIAAILDVCNLVAE